MENLDTQLDTQFDQQKKDIQQIIEVEHHKLREGIVDLIVYLTDNMMTKFSKILIDQALETKTK